ncbi:hypothetical protein DRO69_10825 [Candidatus Bathyarchaeota archaeon]|mgnify:CR=1 FL=1|nr:MAG: hypothetical protein DRO69_10825 [Candidatus Bathyarchaeota archaeon]
MENTPPDREFWVRGDPAPFATRGELLWKKALNKNLPQCYSYSQEQGVIIGFHLTNLFPRGQPLDIDNLCEPVFSILINKKGWFGGRRPNLYWWQATKSEDPPTGCRIQIFSTGPPSMRITHNLVFDGYFPGPLPRNARDPNMPAWFHDAMDKRQKQLDTLYLIHLRFDNAKINIGDISTGVVKSTIDCLYPVVGGSAGRPEDWRISILRIEKSKGDYSGEGVNISIWKLD